MIQNQETGETGETRQAAQVSPSDQQKACFVGIRVVRYEYSDPALDPSRYDEEAAREGRLLGYYFTIARFEGRIFHVEVNVKNRASVSDLGAIEGVDGGILVDKSQLEGIKSTLLFNAREVTFRRETPKAIVQKPLRVKRIHPSMMIGYRGLLAFLFLLRGVMSGVGEWNAFVVKHFGLRGHQLAMQSKRKKHVFRYLYHHLVRNGFVDVAATGKCPSCRRSVGVVFSASSCGSRLSGHETWYDLRALRVVGTQLYTAPHSTDKPAVRKVSEKEMETFVARSMCSTLWQSKRRRARLLCDPDDTEAEGHRQVGIPCVCSAISPKNFKVLYQEVEFKQYVRETLVPFDRVCLSPRASAVGELAKQLLPATRFPPSLAILRRIFENSTRFHAVLTAMLQGDPASPVEATPRVDEGYPAYP